ncbi:MAG: Rid family detoxifying hydrolase [Segetibacter sp.]
MDKRIINTTKAPAPIGPYNQAIISNNMIFISGQIALHPATNELISGDISAETHQVMHNLHEILEEAGLNFNHVVKTTIFLKDMALFAKVNEVYGSYFSADYPARRRWQSKDYPKM